MQQFISDLNLLSRFLALRDVPALTPKALLPCIGAPQADLLIVLGGILPFGCEAAAAAFSNGIAKNAILAGGAGHTTPYFRAQVAARAPQIKTAGKSEAEIMHALFLQNSAVDPARIFLESTSTNCGENAAFALRTAQQHGLPVESVLLMHDSTMQRRIDATFRKIWPQHCRFFNHAAYLPQLCLQPDGTLGFAGEPLWGMWTVTHFISLVLGEIARLWDTPDGYGPNGKNYIAHVEIPAEVLAAYARAQAAAPEYGIQKRESV